MVEEREWGGEWARGKSHLREPGQAATPELSHLLRLLSPTEDRTAPPAWLTAGVIQEHVTR